MKNVYVNIGHYDHAWKFYLPEPYKLFYTLCFIRQSIFIHIYNIISSILP